MARSETAPARGRWKTRSAAGWAGPPGTSSATRQRTTGRATSFPSWYTPVQGAGPAPAGGPVRYTVPVNDPFRRVQPFPEQCHTLLQVLLLLNHLEDIGPRNQDEREIAGSSGPSVLPCLPPPRPCGRTPVQGKRLARPGKVDHKDGRQVHETGVFPDKELVVLGRQFPVNVADIVAGIILAQRPDAKPAHHAHLLNLPGLHCRMLLRRRKVSPRLDLEERPAVPFRSQRKRCLEKEIPEGEGYAPDRQGAMDQRRDPVPDPVSLLRTAAGQRKRCYAVLDCHFRGEESLLPRPACGAGCSG